jgi:hypothetical protein
VIKPIVVQSLSSSRIVLAFVLFQLYGNSALFAQHYMTTFGAVTEFRSGRNARGIITGDFNGDGFPDLLTHGDNQIICNYQDAASFSWHPVPIHIENTIIHAVAAKCNADRCTDLILLVDDPPGLQVYLGKQQNKFYLSWKSSLSVSFESFVAADINNDGYIDILAFGKKELGVTVYLGKGNGTFRAEPVILFPEYSFSALSVADINTDGIHDVLATNWISNELLVFSGFGKMKFSEPVIITYADEPSLFTVAKLDTDNNVDLVIASPKQKSYQTYLGNGLGEFHLYQTISLENSPTGLSVEDINGDGKDDICVLSQSGKSIRCDLNNGSGRIDEHILMPAGDVPKEFLLLRHRNTSFHDAVILDQSTSNIRLLLNARAPNEFHTDPVFITGTSPARVIIADINHDQWPDVLVANTGSSTLSLFLNNGEGNFSGQISLPIVSPAKNIEYVSKNDSIALFLGTTPEGESISLMELNIHDFSRQSYSLPTIGNAEIIHVQQDSLTHGLRIYALEQDASSRHAAVIEFQQIAPTRFTERNVTPVLPFPLMTAIMYDYNGDGNGDLICAMYDAKHRKELICSARGTTSGMFDTAKILFSFEEQSEIPLRLWMADLNGDKIPDLLMNLQAPENMLMSAFGINDTAMTQPSVIGPKNGIYLSSTDHLKIMDMNADGVSDLIFENDLKKSIQLYLGKGNGTFLPLIRLASTERLGGFTIGTITHENIPELIMTDDVNGIVKFISLEDR